jgi:hypothetical protein
MTSKPSRLRTIGTDPTKFQQAPAREQINLHRLFGHEHWHTPSTRGQADAYKTKRSFFI